MTATRRTLCLLVAVAALMPVAACGGSDARAPVPATPLDRLIAAYGDADVDPSPGAWAALVADPQHGSQPVVVLEFVRLRDGDGARSAYDAWLAALAPSVAAAGGEILSVNDTLMPGLEAPAGYDGGVSWIGAFPSIDAYVTAMLDERATDAAARRRDAVAEAQVLVGPDLLPDQIKQLPPQGPASDYPSDHVTGRTADAIVADLLAIYPSGGADPTEATLRAMIGYDGFARQRVHFINLYRFNEAPEGGRGALGEYNAAAFPTVLAHGGRPKALVDVTHHLAGPVQWDRFIFVAWPSLAVFTDVRLDPKYVEAQKDRVASGAEYGNLITIARADEGAGQ